MDRTFELYDKGMKIIESVVTYRQGEIAENWVELARPHMRGYWWGLLNDELGGKEKMFSVP